MLSLFIAAAAALTAAGESLTDLVNPLLGTATLWDAEDLGYVRHSEKRTWGAEVFPGAALPNAMVQLTPVTMWHTGAGYQYEDTTILGFAHTAMGHWNLIDLPMMAVTGRFDADDYASPYSHDNESARPGYYSVRLGRYGIDAELTATLRCGFHRYRFADGGEKHLLVNVAHNQGPVRDWEINRVGENAFAGRQNELFYYAVTNLPIDSVRILPGKTERSVPVAVIDFRNDAPAEPLEVRVGISYVSIDNARLNLETEMLSKSFDQVRREADETWETLLGRIEVKGSTEREKRLFYTTLYRSMLMPRLESDADGRYRDQRGEIAEGAGFRYYSNPAFWDVARSQLILLGMLQPDVATDIIRSTIDRGEKDRGFIPTYFHGDFAPAFVIGSWKRGIRGFDLRRAYKLALKSATVAGRGGRPYMKEYLEKGYVSDENLPDNPFWEEHKGGVTKTLEYAYADYAVAQIARELGDTANYRILMNHSRNYRNVFNPANGFFQGRIEGGDWLTPYDPDMGYFQHQYREANGWNSLFYAPHDPEGVVALYPSAEAVEEKLDTLFTRPYNGLEIANMTGFIGNYCHGNQPGHNIPYTYYFTGHQEKAQQRLNQIMDRFYDMGREHLAYCGMDDAGGMSAWYALNALGIFTYSPADAEYIVSVPLFSDVAFRLRENTFRIRREGSGTRIRKITVGGKPLKGYFVGDSELRQGKSLVIYTD
ncbi:MAG: GH92 family glycosyl hydrolase [Clostridium sp.]|nr:GH92 family glycosyl hydrolase [Clostridium sp.]